MQFRQGAGHNLGIIYNRHKISITIPARHDMNMNMAGKTGAGSPADIKADIVAFGL